MTATTKISRPNDLSAFWMPFTANRQFKQAPRMLVSAEGMYYQTDDNRQILDGTAGLWCCNAGHKRPKIVEAVKAQMDELDYAPAFQMGHPKAFELASRLAQLMPGDLNHVFYTNSGSESVETALKIAIAYHRARGDGQRTRLIGRERGYHGVNFGGISVGGISGNRKTFGQILADDLERICALHDPSTIAAVIVEPVAGSTGVLIPPKGYLERLREICTKHGILLIFDEVITGFGRLGAPFAVDYFSVQPDLVTTAKGLTNGTIPMGAVFATDDIHDTFMSGPENMIELFHGYTYSGNPVACAAGLATLETYEEDGLYTRGQELGQYWEDAVHSLIDLPKVKDIRNLGLIGAIELEGIEGFPTKRAFSAFLQAFEKGILIRTTGDIIALSPPLIIEKSHIDQLFGTLRDVLKEID